jgi:hypothetical protein
MLKKFIDKGMELSSKQANFEARKYAPHIVIGATSSGGGTQGEGYDHENSEILSAHEAISSLFSGYKSNIQNYNLLQPELRRKPMSTVYNK